jgi:hypothetical protein
MMGFSLRFLSSTVERRLWSVWIAATWLAGLALARATLSGDLAVAAICGVLPGWILAAAGDGAFGEAARDRLHRLVLRGGSSPLWIAALLVPSLLLVWVFGSAAINVLVGTVTVLLTAVVSVVILLVGLAVVVGLGIAALSETTSQSSGPTSSTVRTKPLDLTASFRREVTRRR